MALNLASPGVKIREVDLTIGRVDAGNDLVGAIAGPFSRGPVNTPTLVTSEQELIELFGKPVSTDGQSEYWLSASNYLSYGGSLNVIRCNSSLLNNANAGVSVASTTLNIQNFEDYDTYHKNDTSWKWAAKNPGTWANGIKVCVIDNGADQIISGVSTSATSVETYTEVASTYGFVAANTVTITGVTTAGIATGQSVRSAIGGVFAANTVVAGIVSTSNGQGSLTISPASLNTVAIAVTVSTGDVTTALTGSAIQVGYAVTQAVSNVVYATGAGTTTTFTGTIRGLITNIGTGSVSVKIVDRIASDGTITKIDYSQTSAIQSLSPTTVAPIYVSNSSGITTETYTSATISDWYSQQTLGLTNSTVYWSSIAQKPGTSQYSLERSGKNDELHVVIVDDDGTVTGVAGNILEKYTNLSKASDGRIIPGEANYYKNSLASASNYIYAGLAETGNASSLNPVGSSTSSFTVSSGLWGTEAQGITYNVVGARTYSLTGGADYSSGNGFSVGLSDVVSAYQVLDDTSEYDVDFIIGGPSTGASIYEAQAKANALIAIANNRKDCIAVISPYKSGVINITNTTTQTNNVLEFFAPLTSSSYAVFDSGYKYMFDRFNNTFEYVACSADVAGLMARTSINRYSWFSPAGTARGAINNIVKLAYNPSQSQRDELYSNRVNPIISSPGAGFILFGDKTALGYASAFDRINVRRLFLSLERAIESAARDQLFEFNDIITRTNFVNIVDPYLRDVQAKRGITDYVLICDETNNTPDIIDANEFRADIYVQPARSINFVGLTFVATRTGISFSEVIGTV